MKVSQMTLQGKVTAASATSVTVTPGVDTWDSRCAGTITTLTIAGTGMSGFAVGDPLTVRISG
jgi:hypothetical protein